MSNSSSSGTQRQGAASKILLVNNSADMYGASRRLLRLAQLLEPARFEPIVLLPESGPLENALHASKVRTVVFPQLSVINRKLLHPWALLRFALGFPRSVLHLTHLLRSERIELVHTNTGVVISPSLAARLAGVPHVWHIRDWFQEFSVLWRFYEKWMRAFSTRIIAVSGPIAEQFADRAKVRVINNGFDPLEFQLSDPGIGAEFRKRYGLGDSPVVGCVGRIKLKRKGQEVLLKAAGLLKGRGVRAKWLIVGAPFPGNESHLATLHEIVREEGLSEDVIFTGELPDPRPAYAAMDIVVLPSAQPEPFGGVVMEAMCMGLPVIATNIGGSIEQVVEGESGYLIPPNDPAALAEKLEMLLRDETLRKRFGAAGRHRIAEHFTLDGMVQKIVCVYDECLTRK